MADKTYLVEVKRIFRLPLLIGVIGTALCFYLDELEFIKMTINNPMALGEGSVSCVLHYITGGYVFGGVFCSYLMPIFAAIPYASSYCMEENDQFVAYKIVRSGKNHIVLQKH